jgi:outer membrane receptor protein involved in Fe transport
MRIVVLAIVTLLAAYSTPAQNSYRISGTVVDKAGRAVAGASVTLRAANQILETVTGDSGTFYIDIEVDEAGSLEVIADGFEPVNLEVRPPAARLTIELSPRRISEQVTVTRTETRIDETPASVVVLTSRDLETSAAVTLDDRLRQVPGFSLFRRAGSRTANPTTQGVSLRGVGASGASRALVLADGVPLNDPFGGWVYWGRVPAESISQIEVLRGPAGDLYGSSAIGGVISIVTRRPTIRPFLGLETSYGTQRTPTASFYGSAGLSKWAGSIAGEFLETDGFITVAPEQRGPVDTNAGVRRSVLVPTIERQVGSQGRAFVTAEFFRERRANGTPLQKNDTSLRNFTAGIDFDLADAGNFAIRAHGGTQSYDQSFSAIAADRSSESLIRLQHVPSESFGGNGQWNGNLGKATLFAGFDARVVRGRSDETGFAANVATSESSSGGREFTTGVFAGGILSVSRRLEIGGSVRYDHWRNHHGSSVTRVFSTGAATTTEFPDRSESAISPRASALYRVSKNVSLAGTISAGFRRPTLNELYRNFRVGDVLTLANANLQAERALGSDAAILLTGFSRRVFVRTGAFCTEVSGNISNVTLSIAANLITRQRQNIGRTRSCGLETDGQIRVSDHFRISGGYLFADARVTSFPANVSLEGLLIPQVARHQFTFQGEYSDPKFATVGLQLRTVSSQFDDDQNQFRLAGFATVEGFISRQLTNQLAIFAAVENLFDSRIESGRTPVLTLASPRTVRAGVRLRLGKDR